MAFNPGLSPGQMISNDELVEIFDVNPQQGMRKSRINNVLVLVTDRIRSGYYKDREVDGVYYYTGMGQGNQHLDYKQNRTLAESRSTNIPVFYFEKFKKNKYIYIGEVELAGEPFREVQNDEFNKPRTVYIFPLQLKDGQKEPVIPEELSRESMSKPGKG